MVCQLCPKCPDSLLISVVADNGLIALNLIHEAHRQSKRAGPARKKLYDCVLMDLEMPGKLVARP